MVKNIFFLFLVSCFFSACCNSVNNFDENGKIAQDFLDRRNLVPEKYFSVFDGDLDGEKLQAMQFLYAYMPLPDIADYPSSFYLQNVDYALKARKEMPWGEDVPVREFMHFVLPVRVNNEDMDTSRAVFYNELKERVCNLSMRDAVLEVNHWCHEKVTYTPSDSRTSSPLASVRTAYGRCGEESTFTVAALRAVGIPARQVYTPRWAHTDDNHAWVEAWVDGEWHFLGACEPEPVLDLAWFNAPASRGMLMHTKAFGHYNGPEEVVSRTPCYTEINVTANYAPVAPVTVRVVDEEERPVQTTVEYKIYNYSEFFTAATRMSDAAGYATLSTGKGSLLVWAAKEGKFGYASCFAGDGDTILIKLDKAPGYRASFPLDIIPPKERNTTPELSPEQIAENASRFAREDSIRNAYISTFISAEQAAEIARTIGADAQRVITLFEKSRGNYATIEKFLLGVAREDIPRALSLLSVISEKDLRDISVEVLNDHLANTIEKDVEDDIYTRYVLNPRVSNELLTPYKKFFANLFDNSQKKQFQLSPALWEEWCRNNIEIDDNWNPIKLCMSPRGVWNMRVCDAHSRNIFFVSGARSWGIPACIDEVTGKVQYMQENGSWVDASFEIASEAVVAKGVLSASFSPTTYIEDPKYYSHFSISKIVDGRLQLQNYPENTTLTSLLKNGTMIDAGDYLLVTGTRMADGGVLAHLTFLGIPDNGYTKMQYVQRESNDKLQVIGGFNSENLYYDINSDSERSILSSTGRGYYILALVAPNNEPTNHFLNDIQPYSKQFEDWGQKIVMLFGDKGEYNRFANDFPSLPSTIVWGTDLDGRIFEEVALNMKLTAPVRPVIIVADTFNRVVFVSQGYSIGLGEQLAKVVKQLQE